MLKLKLSLILSLLGFSLNIIANEAVSEPEENNDLRGIYLNQYTIENQKKLTRLINAAQEHGINALVIDLDRYSDAYANNIHLITQTDMHITTRIEVFPTGGTKKQVQSLAYWQSRYKLAKKAIDLGTDKIQLDYIRYKPSQTASNDNAHDIKAVIAWFEEKVEAHNIPLQVTLFGIASFGPSVNIGHDITVFAEHIDSVAPMLYPSHFMPYQKHSKDPYGIVSSALTALKDQFSDEVPFTIIAYIEMHNYRYPMRGKTKENYIDAQIKAVNDADVSGWYAWSATNNYDRLFSLLKRNNYLTLR